MKKILFFGDSNTWGYDCVTGGRYDEETRFTGRIAKTMPQWKIIEEGLKGRTNGYDDGPINELNGRKMLPALLCTQDPIDLLVIMLGTNDTKSKFHSTPYEISRELELNIRLTQHRDLWDGLKDPEILVVAPSPVTAKIQGTVMEGHFDSASITCSEGLAAEFRHVADKCGCAFFDAEVCLKGEPKRDGVHLTEKGHEILAEGLITEIQKILK